MKENYFKFRESFGIAILPMTDKQAGQLLKGLCNYAFDGRPIVSSDCAVKSVFTLIKTAIKQDEKDKENGRKGGIKSAEQIRERQEKFKLLAENAMQSILTETFVIALSESPDSEDSDENAAARILKNTGGLSEAALRRKVSTAKLINSLETLEEIYDSMEKPKKSNTEQPKKRE